MLDKVKKWCERHHLLKSGDTVLIACSGGADSLALTDILMALKDAFHLRLAVGHLDHMFRGAASVQDAAFVAEFCKSRGLSCYQRRVDVPAFQKRHGLSPEEAARIVRYDFLREIANNLGGAKIATGHHQGDQAETVLLHLIRGAGSGGIGGIRPVSRDVIRPLLAVSRAEIDAYCKARDLDPRVDETNFTTDYLRNRIRLELLPRMERAYNPAMREALCRSAELIGAEHEFIRQSAEALWGGLASERNGLLALRRSAFNALHTALKREFIRLAIERLQGSLSGIQFFHVEEIIRMAATGRVGAILELPSQLVLECGYNAVNFFKKNGDSAEFRKENVRIELNLDGITEILLRGIVVEAEMLPAYRKPVGPEMIVCDLDRLALPLFLRFREDGDVFQPSGMRGKKKLKDFFIDAKIARARRDDIPLFCDQSGIIWVGGYRQSQTSKVTESTTKFLALTLRKVKSGGAEC